MPRPKRAEEEIAVMRQRILDAAAAILREEGPGGMSIRAIAERVGISHMVLYSYFENRDDLWASLREKQHERVQARHAAMLARAQTGDVREVVREVLEWHVSFAHDNPRIYRFLWCASPEHTADAHAECDMPHSPREGFHQIMHHLADLIQMGIERGAFVKRDPFLAALMVSGMINGPLVMYFLPGIIDEETLKRLECEAVEAGLNYLTT